MNIQDLRIFARVAAVQNISAVAAELQLTPGTVSKRIQALENEFKARLLDRTTRSMRLTQEGHLALAHILQSLQAFDLAHDTVSSCAGQPAGRLRVSAPTALSRSVVAPAVLSFIEVYPAINLRLDVTDRVVNLQEEDYDAAIRTGALHDSSLKAKRIAIDRMILVASPQYIERFGAPTSAEALMDHHCLVHRDDCGWTLLRGSQQWMVSVTARLRSDCNEMLHRAAMDGVGILRTSEIAVWDELLTGQFVHVLPDHELASGAGVWVVYPNAKHAMVRLRVFIDHLAEQCRTLRVPATPPLAAA